MICNGCLLLYLIRFLCGSPVLLCCMLWMGSLNSLSPLFPDNVETTPSGGITYNTFVGLWSLLLRYESTLTLYTLLQLGYWKDYHVLIRWVKWEMKEELICSKDQRDRRFVHCCVVGDDQVGKVLFTYSFKIVFFDSSVEVRSAGSLLSHCHAHSKLSLLTPEHGVSLLARMSMKLPSFHS